MPIFAHPDVIPEKRLKHSAAELARLSANFDQSDFEHDGSFSWSRAQLLGYDAMVYCAMIRRYRLGRVIEIGSGQSTFVAFSALRENGKGGIYCFDPETRTDIAGLVGIRLARCRVQGISLTGTVQALEPANILFYCGGHFLKTGSSAVYFYRLLLQDLRPSVLIHVHHGQLPHPRNIKALPDARLYWISRFIVMGYLYDTSRYCVFFGSEFAKYRFPDIACTMLHGKSATGEEGLWSEVLKDFRKSRSAAYAVRFDTRLADTELVEAGGKVG